MSAMDDGRRVLAGRYELVEVIGRGGMGTVYRAVDRVLGRSVAVKLLAGSAADHDPVSIARFEREARAAASLSHPAVVAIYDTGADAGTPFIVMELVTGRSLEAILRADGPLPPERAVGVAASVADALAAAHAAGIVHRDIKPANVMVASNGTVKVLDFGIARAVDGSTLTQNAAVLGTAAYMSPEQALGQPADERSDIYALGCVLYALLSGHPPFTGDNAAALLNQHANISPHTLRAEHPGVSQELELLVLQMLEKSPEDRPQTTAAVRDRLNAMSITRPPDAPTERLHPTAATRPLPTGSRAHHRAVLVVAVVALVLVAGVITLTSGGSSPDPRVDAHHRTTRTAPKTVKGARSTPAATTTTATSTTGLTAASTTATVLHHHVHRRTVSGTAGALTALATGDAQTGTIDQQAGQQISNGLTNILNSYEMGNTMNAEQQLTNLSQQLTMLEQQGHVTSAAAPALNEAVANLGTALTHAPTVTTKQPAAQPPNQHPGKGGPPPGQAKKHGH
jgi:eukaryotic-like serine/threonine-protein kinase